VGLLYRIRLRNFISTTFVMLHCSAATVHGNEAFIPSRVQLETFFRRDGMLKHVVFMKFKEETTDGQISDLERSLGALPAVIPEIKLYEHGRDVVRSERSYDFCLVSAFEDLEALKRYQVHPDHVAVLNKVREMCGSILAVDFEM
jgi:hypothetical protein